MVIEVDGGVHVGRETQDRERERTLEELGYRVMRFTNDEIEKEINQVVEAIRAALDVPPHYLLVPMTTCRCLGTSISAYRSCDKIRPGPPPELAIWHQSDIMAGGGSALGAPPLVPSPFRLRRNREGFNSAEFRSYSQLLVY